MDRMWKKPSNNNSSVPYGQRLCKSAPCSPAKPMVTKANNGPCRADSFHVVHKVPVGDTPYVKAKHVQLVDKDPERAIALFWAAINAGDRVDSALKDMAIVMKQQNRPEEAIEAIKSLRNRCSDQAQESLDNVLLDLYKRCGRLDDQIALLKHKLNLIHQGLAFNGKRTKTARSQGKKFQVSIEQEATRLLGNLGWAYMQQFNYIAAEAVYRKALSIELDNNKMCNLGICLMHQGRVTEAKAMLHNVKPASVNGPWGLDSHLKSYERAQEMLRELEGKPMNYNPLTENSATEGLKSSVWQSLPCPWKHTENNQNVYEKPSSNTVDSEDTTLHATSGFGPSQQNSKVSSDKNFQFSMFSNGLIEEDYFADENVNINSGINVSASSQNRTPFGLPKICPTQQNHADVLSQKLDKLRLKENGNPKGSPFRPLTSSYRDQSDFGDENININAIINVSASPSQSRAPFGFPQICPSQQSHAEILRQKLIIGLKENDNDKSSAFPPLSSSYRDQSGLNSAAPPFFSKHASQREQQSFFSNGLGPSFEERTNEHPRMPFEEKKMLGLVSNGRTTNTRRSTNPIQADLKEVLGQSLENETKPSFIGKSLKNETRPAARRALSFESIDAGLDLPPLPIQVMMTSSNTVPPLLKQDNKGIDPWDTLGFLEAPDSKDFEQVTMSESPKSNQVPAQHQKCHSRLRVFQEMTLPASPKA